MNINDFRVSLADALVRRGIPQELAESKSVELVEDFTPEELDEVVRAEDMTSFSGFSDELARYIKGLYKSEPAKSAKPEAEPDECELSEKVWLTESGKKHFTAYIILIALPLFIAAVVYYSLFGAAFATLFAILAAGVAALIGTIAAGSACAIVGIVYGITRFFKAGAVGEGIFEIGLGLAVAAFTLALGILIYNFAVRFMPYTVRQAARLYKHISSGFASFLDKKKKECNEK